MAEQFPPGVRASARVPERGSPVVDLDEDHRIEAARRLRVCEGDNATLQSLSLLAAQLLRTRSAKISVVTEFHEMVAATGVGPGAVDHHRPREESLSAVTTAHGGPLVIGETAADPRVRQLPLVRNGSAGCFLGVPLVDSGGELVGALCAYDPHPRVWHRSDVVLMQELAQAVVSELERLALAREHETDRLRLDLALDVAGLGSWDWDVPTGRLVLDERMERMFGFRPGEFAGTVEALDTRLHPDDLPVVAAALEVAVAGGGTFDETFRVLRPGRSVRWICSRGRAVRDRHGAVVRVVGASSDVTEQRASTERTDSMVRLLELVASASRVLADSLETADAVRALARLVVPTLADWAIVALVGRDGSLRNVEYWHEDADQREVLSVVAAHLMSGSRLPGAVADVLTRRQPIFVDSSGAARAEQWMDTPEACSAIRALNHETAAVLPLVARDRVVGMLALARGPERSVLTAAEAAAAVEVAERAARVLEHAHSYDQVRTLSEQLQRSMLTEPVQPEGIEIAVSYTPASQAAQVGGDWYDAFVQPDGATMVVVGDVIGHDSASAAAMGHLRALTRGIAYSTGDSPAGVLTAVARAMDGLDVDTIATAVLARLQRDPETGVTRMTWSSAGHPPALLRRPDGSTQLLESEDLLLGLVADAPRQDHHLVLEPGSVVLMFTDGLVERRGEAISVGLSRLQAVVDEGHDLGLPDLLAHLHRELLPMDPDDDVAVLALQTVPVSGAGGLTAPAV